MKKTGGGEIGTIAFIALLAIVVIGGLMMGLPHYSVYRQRLEGAALLAHAQSAKEVAVAEAKAKMESADLLKRAEIIRADGVAQANKIIGESLKGHNEYLTYLWIVDVAAAGTDKTVVYVPTEGNLPILEAARLGQLPNLEAAHPGSLK